MNRHRLTAALCAVALAGTLGVTGIAVAQALPGARVDLKVLVVTDGGPNAAAIASHLKTEGVPFDTVDLTRGDRPVITPGFLTDTSQPGTHARYQAVVLPNSNPFLNPAEATALFDYERQFGIRQVSAYVWPSAAVGLNAPTYAGRLDGVTATVTPVGLAGPFKYLRGPVPFEDANPEVWETYGYLAQAASPDLTPLVTVPAPDGGPTGVLLGELRADGREQLVMTFSANAAQEQFRLLAPGIVTWMTRGVHLGYHRNYFSVHVDDVFHADARWHVGGNCTPGNDCRNGETTPLIRMTAEDAKYAVQWQAAKKFTLDMAYNALGSVEAVQKSPTRTDPLTTELTANRDAFRWLDHTYSHPFVGCVRDMSVLPWRCVKDANGATRYVPRAEIRNEINKNRNWATKRGYVLDSTELVTGEHSGLKILPQQPDHNPHLGPALRDTGVRWLAADNSRMPEQVKVGNAYTVPRHPLSIFYNVGTAAEEVDEYNWIYTSRTRGGSGICDDNPTTTTCVEPLDPQTGWTSTIIPVETRMAINRILNNDPRPHYVHQGNLAEDRLLYPMLDSILDTYRSLLADNTPIVCQKMARNGAELKRQTEWQANASQVTAYLRDGVVTVTAPSGVQVPLTVPEGSKVGDKAFGQRYAGERSDWFTGSTAVTVP